VRRFRDAPGRPARILWGACDPLFTPSPLGPLLAVAEGTGGELRAVVERGAMPYQVVAALAHELSARAPAVFVLEDVHWADEATLDVLRLLARRVETVPALVVASYRDDALDRAHPLRMMLGELARSPTVGRLQLVRLSPEAAAQLAEPHGVDPGELYRKTAGNPFFVVEALAAGAATVPDTVRDAVLARAARLSPAGARLLEALAGDAAGRLDECLTSGMLVSEATGVAFPTSWPGSPWRSRCHRTAGWSCTAGPWPRSPARPVGRRPTWPGSPTTPRPPATPAPSSAWPPRPPPGRRRWAPTGRRPPSTAGPCGPGASSRPASGPSCSSAAPPPAT
jgi:hypothetical protein